MNENPYKKYIFSHLWGKENQNFSLKQNQQQCRKKFYSVIWMFNIIASLMLGEIYILNTMKYQIVQCSQIVLKSRNILQLLGQHRRKLNLYKNFLCNSDKQQNILERCSTSQAKWKNVSCKPCHDINISENTLLKWNACASRRLSISFNNRCRNLLMLMSHRLKRCIIFACLIGGLRI